LKNSKMKFLLTGEETERLKFRLLEPADFDTWIELFKDPASAGFLGMAHLESPQKQCEEWFSRCEKRYQDDLGGMNVLIDKNTGAFIGQCGLLIQEVDGVSELEIGYSILPQHRNLGYATEAARKCRDVAFTNSYAGSLLSIINVNNISSEKVARRNGMKKTKRTIFRDMPVNIFRIEKKDWEVGTS